MALNLGELLKQQDGPKMGTAERIEYIPLDRLEGDERNFYQLSDIDGLAANIELIGLQQPIRVREAGARFRIVSGHRRHAAIRKLVEDGNKNFERVACIVETVECSEAMQELRLIYANSDTRKMSGPDLAKQAERVEALLYQLKEEGFEFPGRMRDHVAQACQTSKSKLSRLKVIREKLDPVWTPHYESGEIKENAAYALAQLSGSWQRIIYAEVSKKNNGIRYFYQGDADRAAEYLKKLEELECPYGGHCGNNIGKFQHMMGAAYCYDHCENKCCSKCENLGSCKKACHMLKEKIDAIKADKKEAKRQEQIAKEAAAAPKVELLSELWTRFGEARTAAGVSVKRFREAVGSYYYGSTDERDFAKHEQGQEVTESSALPYGYNFDYGNCKRLIDAADCLGVSLDYLFGRTEQRTMPAQPEGQLVFNGWMPGGTTPSNPCDAVAVFDFEDGGKLYKQFCHWDGYMWKFSRKGAACEMQPVKWMALPPDEEDA